MTITAFTSTDKTTHNSHKFGFKLSPTNYGFWKTMIQPFLITNDLFDYIDGSLICPPKILPSTSSASDKEPATKPQNNPDYSAWISNDAHIRMLLLSTISEASFKHVQGDTSRELWLALERAYAPHTSSREYTLKTQLLKIKMKPEETSADYIKRAQEYSDALANIGEPMKDKDIVMLVIAGLREEYDSLKPTLIGRQPCVTLLELPSLLADYEYMIKKVVPVIPAVQAFLTTANQNSSHSNSSSSPQLPDETIKSLQQLMTQLGFTVQPASQSNQAFYTNRGSATRGAYNR
ncbi:uncharacterized protein LOC118485863 [Helianthus annuus]|uniref:uncharacterized protein LOC118485863 n=1 Tax=Helianthus annuus TaxID=4232 RepID=UPI0016533262|nr:uncharacterized protein LOC118485863 [Helianthus annuus]